MAFKRSALSFNLDVFPLRLIDVSATLHSRGGIIFADASDWSFHVISHTWSQDIRNLSVSIGEDPNVQEGQSAGLKYSDCFAKANFAGNPAYKKLIDFLYLLQADSVGKIWFDALCINQTDDGEKAAEIANMGAYYACSAGCYVAAHGIGTEVGFRAVEGEFKLPRWFTRVWTYQEWVLPKNLMFIVEMVDADTRSRLQAILSSLDYKPSTDWLDWDKELEEEIYSSEIYFRRRIVCEDGSMSKRDLFVISDVAYCTLQSDLSLHLWNSTKLEVPTAEQFYLLFSRMQNADNIALEEVVRHIQERDCTVEEDRVLGMVGLLGFEGNLQVRTKQTLQQQLLWLAHTLMNEKPNLLVNLCAAGLEGYHEMPCASWLPKLWCKKLLEFPFNPMFAVVRSPSATVVWVKQDGKLVMRARSIRGSLIYFPVSDQSVLEASGMVHKTLPHSASMKVENPEASGMVHKTLLHSAVSLKVEDPQAPYNNVELMRGVVASDYRKEGGGLLMFQTTKGLHLGTFCIPAPSIYKLLEYKHQCPCICQPTLLLLGHNEAGTNMMMLCVRDADSGELHKVAVLVQDLGFGKDSMPLFPAPPQEYVISGFGNDLTRFLSKECQEILQRCNH